MDILNKKILTPTPTPYRHRTAALAILLTLATPGWADMAPPLPPPLDLPAVNAINSNGSPSGNSMAVSQAMRFITLGRVTFVSDKWQLTDAAQRLLDKVAAYLLTNPGAERVLLDAHTDWVGGAHFNDKLSDQRARSVEDYLVSKGIDPTLIHWRGHGEHAPIDENWTRLGRDRNRQVEMYAIYLPRS
jgi:outer membrane protein OmpA-like peptidoglycan-associated protein